MIRIEYNATVTIVEWVNEEDLDGHTLMDIEERFESGDVDDTIAEALADLTLNPTKADINVECDSYSVEEDPGKDNYEYDF